MPDKSEVFIRLVDVVLGDMLLSWMILQAFSKTGRVQIIEETISEGPKKQSQALKQSVHKVTRVNDTN